MRILIPLFIVFLIACKKDDPEPSLLTTSIEVECNRDKGDSFLVGEDIVLTITLTTDPTIGISSFTIEKEDTELFMRSDYTTNIVEFVFTYTTSREDLEVEEVTFDFILTDKAGTTKTSDIEVAVKVDLPNIVDLIDPEPGWNLVTDMAVDTTNKEEVDIYEFREIDDNETRVYWTSLNGTQFYDIPEDIVDFLDINLAYAELEAAISNITPQDTILLTTISFGSTPPPLPIIVDLRNTQELILIDYSNVQQTMAGYRKRD